MLSRSQLTRLYEISTVYGMTPSTAEELEHKLNGWLTGPNDQEQ